MSEPALERHEHPALQARGIVVQAASMWCVERRDSDAAAFEIAGRQTGVSASFGAMPVDDVDLQCLTKHSCSAGCCEVVESDRAAHRDTMQTQAEVGGHRVEASLGEAVGCIRVANHADIEAPARLFAG